MFDRLIDETRQAIRAEIWINGLSTKAHVLVGKVVGLQILKRISNG